MITSNYVKINNELHTIIRFISECQIKHSFIFNQLTCEELDKCLKYLIQKDLNIECNLPFERQKIKKILTTVINNSMNIEIIFCTKEKPLVEKSIFDDLYVVLELL